MISWGLSGVTEVPEHPARLNNILLNCADGRMLAANNSPHPDSGVTSLLIDVTEVRRNGLALVQARDRAAAADQSKSRFLRAANHDLRQPLASLKIFVYSCLVAENEEDRKQALHAMDVSISIMEDLLGSLLNVGQLDAGKIEPTIATFQISSILARLGVQYAHQAREKGLDLRIVPSKLAVVSDRVLLERILSNSSAMPFAIPRSDGFWWDAGGMGESCGSWSPIPVSASRQNITRQSSRNLPRQRQPAASEPQLGAGP